jgi:hypothetical protein
MSAGAPKYTKQYVPGPTFRLQNAKKPAYMRVFGGFRLQTVKPMSAGPPKVGFKECRAPKVGIFVKPCQ